MANTINKLMRSSGPETYYNPSFCRLLETYLPYIFNNPDNTILTVKPHDLYKYEGDVYGLLAANGVPSEYRWVTMRINGLVNPAMTPDEIGYLIIPSINVLRDIKNIFKTTYKKEMP